MYVFSLLLYLHVAQPFFFFLVCEEYYRQQEKNKEMSNSTAFPDVIPPYRRPTPRQLRDLLPAAKRRQKLAAKSFEALALLASINKESVIR